MSGHSIVRLLCHVTILSTSASCLAAVLVARVAAAGRGGVGAVVLVTCTNIFKIYFHNFMKYLFGCGSGHLLCFGSEARWWSSHCPGHHLTSGGHLVACQRSTCSWGSACGFAVSGWGSIVATQLLLVRFPCSSGHPVTFWLSLFNFVSICIFIAVTL